MGKFCHFALKIIYKWPKERIRIRNMISEIASDKIVLFATHVVSDIEQIAKEVIFLKDGRMIGQDPPEKFYDYMEGKVYEARVTPEELTEIEKNCLVRNRVKSGSHILVRFLSDTKQEKLDCQSVRADLEDTYLYHFEGR